jgi:hydrogenase nickel incorporation protein HypA/HybF
MHELSMAQGILNAVLETAEHNGATEVTEIVIEIGKLAMLNPEQVKFMLDVLSKDTIAENAKIVIENLEVEIECEKCGFIAKQPFDKCPKCGETEHIDRCQT